MAYTTLDTTISRLERDINLKVFFAGDDSTTRDATPLRLKSTWLPPPPPNVIYDRCHTLLSSLRDVLQPTQSTSNLSRYQQKILRDLMKNEDVIIASADKNLGPVGIDTSQYIQWGLTHLLDTSTYIRISETSALDSATVLKSDIHAWTLRNRKFIDDDAVRYIRRKLETALEDPFGYFYLLIKLHKTPISTRPVCSDCGSLTHPLGKWVDLKLQPIVRSQWTYFKNSLALKQDLAQMILPPNVSIFTYDAVSMYTNIDTDDCIMRLTTYLSDTDTQTRFPHYDPTSLLEALTIVMHNNRMRFGDITVCQKRGIAMGMSPAPSIANLYVSIYEQTHIQHHFTPHLHYLRRFIDDGFGIWVHDPDPTVDNNIWTRFVDSVNNMGLTWEFTTRSGSVTFMDLTVKLTAGRFTTSLYAKPLALHLYLPPSSCHAPGVLCGLINGHILRITQLCSSQSDQDREIALFYDRLMARGYTSQQIRPLLSTALDRISTPTTTWDIRRRARKTTRAPTDRQIFLHLPYHPKSPSAHNIQCVWNTSFFTPAGDRPITQLQNRDGYNIPIQQLTVAYSRHPNLGNLLSYRRLETRTGLKVSSFVGDQE